MNKRKAEEILQVMGTPDPIARELSITELATMMTAQRMRTEKAMGSERYAEASTEVRGIIRGLSVEFGLTSTVVAMVLINRSKETGLDEGLIMASLSDKLVCQLEAPRA